GAAWQTVAGAITIAAGQTSVQVRSAIVDDNLSEASEDFTLTATVTAGASSNAADTGTATIADDDGVPSLSLSGPAVIDEAAGTVTYTVSLSNPSASTVTVDYASSNGTATAGSDYGAVSGTLSFAAGVTSQSFTVAITDDTVYEGAESFTLDLSAASGATIAVGSVTSTCVDGGRAVDPGNPGGPAVNDDTPTLSVSDVSVTEGTDPHAVFTVSLSNPSVEDVSFTLALASGTATVGT